MIEKIIKHYESEEDHPKRKKQCDLSAFAAMVFSHAVEYRSEVERKIHFERDNPGLKYKPHRAPLSQRDILFNQMKPHVDAILTINDGAGAGYCIVDLPDEHGKRPMRNMDRIIEAQVQFWGVKGKNLKEGDYIWPIEDMNEREYYVGQDDPIKVEEVTKKWVIFDLGRDGTTRGELGETFIKAPPDYNEDDYDDEFWLDKADEMGIK